jgi:hypothetical protein
MYKSTVPLPIGIWLPTITFSVIPLSASTSPASAACAIVGTVISNAALASYTIFSTSNTMSTNLLHVTSRTHQIRYQHNVSIIKLLKP